MRFSARTENELAEANLIPEGIYRFKVIEVADAISEAGNEMIKLTLEVTDHQNHKRILTDYLLEAMAFKLRHFCVATGLLKQYEAGELTAPQCFAHSGEVSIAIQKGKGEYRDRNVIKDYIEPQALHDHHSPVQAQNMGSTQNQGQQFTNDDIQF